MAKRQMIGKIAREDSLAIHSFVQVQWHFGFIFSLVVQNEARLPCALQCVGVWPQHERGRESPNVIEFLLVTSYSPVWHYLTI